MADIPDRVDVEKSLVHYLHSGRAPGDERPGSRGLRLSSYQEDALRSLTLWGLPRFQR
jgi:hypothetical protein